MISFIGSLRGRWGLRYREYYFSFETCAVCGMGATFEGAQAVTLRNSFIRVWQKKNDWYLRKSQQIILRMASRRSYVP